MFSGIFSVQFEKPLKRPTSKSTCLGSQHQLQALKHKMMNCETPVGKKDCTQKSGDLCIGTSMFVHTHTLTKFPNAGQKLRFHVNHDSIWDLTQTKMKVKHECRPGIFFNIFELLIWQRNLEDVPIYGVLRGKASHISTTRCRVHPCRHYGSGKFCYLQVIYNIQEDRHM